ncbi:MAG: HAMP domain-containing protein [Deltaproteobacteria bacterium]|nr:HAMP domain-containing protein [Deltaproteobacteria bacterium]
MRLKKKILTGYGVVFILMGLVIAWAIANLVSLGKATDEILRENYRSILASVNMTNALEEQNSGALAMFLGDREKGLYQYRVNEAMFIEWLGRAKDNITVEGESELVRSIDGQYAEYRRQFSSLTLLTDNGINKINTPYSIYIKEIHPIFTKVRESCLKLRQLNEGTMYNASSKANNMARHAIFSTIITAVSALSLALVLSLILAERITRPLSSFVDASRKISKGDYSVQIPFTRGDELGILANEFNQMTSQLFKYHEINIDQIISEKNKGDAILSSIEDGLMIFDTDLKLTGINPAARMMLKMGYKEISSIMCSDILFKNNLCEFIKKTIETGSQPDIPEEQRIIQMSDEKKPSYFFFSATPIRGRDRKLIGVVVLLRDVTRMKEVEQLKTEFVMAASHELRTPLTSLGMSIALLMEHTVQKLDRRDATLLFAANDDVNRLKSLVSELLDLSKMETGRIKLDFERVSVSTLFKYVEEVFKSQLNIKGVNLMTRLNEDVPDIHADANKVTWVMTNLVSNSLRYVSNGGHINITANRVGSTVHISVNDDGPGIPAEYQKKIFNKFVQVKGHESEGTGLGLAICKEIVRAHGGRIWVESGTGHGSTFIFTLPVAEEER